MACQQIVPIGRESTCFNGVMDGAVRLRVRAVVRGVLSVSSCHL
jgi:hypothetical protein